MKTPTLVVLAAGMGSRYGGLKQMDPVDDVGNKILDFSVYDAMMAGFKKVVFIIKEENHVDFEKYVGIPMKRHIEVEYVFQKLTSIPEGFSVPEGREKPLGTAHALYCCMNTIDGPFAVINADDFYGRDGFVKLYNYLTSHSDDDKYRYTMIAYQLGNTLTENGTVSRGICTVDEDGYLDTIVERTTIKKTKEGAAYTEDGENYMNISVDSKVSMNMWGFSTSFLEELKESLRMFFENDIPKNPLKAECFLPFEVDRLLKEDKASVEVLVSDDKWFGITYKEDKPTVVEAIDKLKKSGIYPEKLW